MPIVPRLNRGSKMSKVSELTRELQAASKQANGPQVDYLFMKSSGKLSAILTFLGASGRVSMLVANNKHYLGVQKRFLNAIKDALGTGRVQMEKEFTIEGVNRSSVNYVTMLSEVSFGKDAPSISKLKKAALGVAKEFKFAVTWNTF